MSKMKVKDIPGQKEFERLLRDDPKEYRRLYRESMKCLDKATARASYAAIIIAAISILLTLTRWLLSR